MSSLNIILIISEDPGGAEILSSWCAQNLDYNFYFLLSGPAIPIYKNKIDNCKIVSTDKAQELIISKFFCQVIITQSWRSKFGLNLIPLAKAKNINTVFSADHWGNYGDFFNTTEALTTDFLCDEVWCGDSHAITNALDLGFPSNILKLVPNEKFNEVKKALKIKKKKQGSPITLLYLTEPTSEHMIAKYNDPLFKGYNEFTILQRFFSLLPDYFPNIKKIIFRTHPNEKHDKYNDILSQSCISKKFEFSTNLNLIDDILESEFVVGCESMALVYSIFANRKTYSILPSNFKLLLPYDEIIRI